MFKSGTSSTNSSGGSSAGSANKSNLAKGRSAGYGGSNRVTGRHNDGSDPCTCALECGRLVVSIVVVIFGIFATFSVVFNQLSAYGKDVPLWLAIFIIIIAYVMISFLEGAQIGLLEIAHVGISEFKHEFPRSHQLQRWLNSDRHGLQKFLHGRQILTYLLLFLLERFTASCSKAVPIFDDAETSAYPFWVQEMFISSGLISSILWGILASLPPQLFAAKRPIVLLNIPGMTYIIDLCVVVEYFSPIAISNSLAELFRWLIRNHSSAVNGKKDERFHPLSNTSDFEAIMMRERSLSISQSKFSQRFSRTFDRHRHQKSVSLNTVLLDSTSGVGLSMTASTTANGTGAMVASDTSTVTNMFDANDSMSRARITMFQIHKV
jgi:hypothetical protein